MAGSDPSRDLWLARRVGAGDTEAWDELVDRHGRRLYNLALHFAGSLEEAEDLTQEIFLRLYRNVDSYRGEVPLIAWALRLSRNLCIDHHRRARRQRDWTRVSEAVLDQLPAPDDVEKAAARRQQLRVVYAALSELPEEQAEVVLLRDLQGWSLEETAAYLEIPLGTMKSRLSRARLRLTERVRARIAPGGGSASGSPREAMSC